ncbi:MAG: BLUF domain-containing protein [Pseudomonadota bacterium]|nr:BLUF domain-containing protein [Pseudomonadota bacterium]
MYCLTYMSTTKIDFTFDDLEALLQVSQANNAAMDITGYLYFDRNTFIQYLEGQESHVKKLMDSITQDPRHEVLLTFDSSIDERRFPSWTMAYLSQSDFSAVRLEDLWKRFFYLSKKETNSQDIHQLWRVIDKISQLQKRIESKFRKAKESNKAD